jgi:hypothetical protein
MTDSELAKRLSEEAERIKVREPETALLLEEAAAELGSTNKKLGEAIATIKRQNSHILYLNGEIEEMQPLVRFAMMAEPALSELFRQYEARKPK